MSHIRVEVIVTKVCDTGTELDEVRAVENFSPKFSTWTILMMIVGFITRVQKEEK